MLTAREIVESTDSVVSPPEVYLRVRQIIDDPNTGLTDVASIIVRDPGLTTRILKSANSAFFGFAAKVETVTQAVSLLGPQLIHDLVLATSVARAFSGVDDRVVNMDIFWQKSIYCAVVSRLLADVCDVINSERLFILGLLYDIGHLAMYQHAAEQCEAAIAKSKNENVPLHVAETELVGCNYAEVGGQLLSFWQLPRELSEPVRNHAAPCTSSDFVKDAAIVHIASKYVESADPDIPLSKRVADIDSEMLEITNLTVETCEEVLLKSDNAAGETLSMIFPNQA